MGYFHVFPTNKNSGLYVRLNLGSFYYTTFFVDIHHYTYRALHSCPFLCRLSLSLCFFRCPKKHMKGEHVYEGKRLAFSFQEQSSNGCLISSSADGHR